MSEQQKRSIDTPEFRKLADEWGVAKFDPINLIDEVVAPRLWREIVAYIDAFIQGNDNGK